MDSSKRKIDQIILHCTSTPEGEDFTNAQIREWHLERGFSDILVKLVKELLQRYPGATVHGHNEFANKACPSFNVKTWLTKVGIKQ